MAVPIARAQETAPTPPARATSEEIPPPPPGEPTPPPGYGVSATVSYPAPTYPTTATSTSPSTAQYVVVQPVPPHTHDGFFFRIALGLGYLTGTNDGLESFSLSGGSGGGSIAVGATVADDLNVHVEIFGGSVVDPALSRDGMDLGDVSTNLNVSALGVGVTYYFMPINIYLAGTLGAGRAVLDDGVDASAFTDTGIALNAMVGKEWWVDSDWAIGAAAQFFLMSLPNGGEDTFGVLALALLFSATYN